jgi:hypothetical protein
VKDHGISIKWRLRLGGKWESLTLKVDIREIEEEDLDFSTVISVNDTRARVNEVLRRQTTPRSHSPI